MGMTKSQIARELKRTVSEIFRMLLCLEQRGYITPVAEKRYSLTRKLFELAQHHPTIERLIADALPVMDWLAHETLQSCHIGVLEGCSVVILAQINAPANCGFCVRPGSTLDIMESATGYVILAYLDPSSESVRLALGSVRRHRSQQKIWPRI
jgi:DNA-binding IclR family transcriptional regulator